MLIRFKFIISISAVFFLAPIFSYAINYSNGTLLREEGDAKVYVIHNNQKRWIRSIDVFNSYGFKWPNVKVISSGSSSDTKNNDLIRLKGDFKVYQLALDGTKAHIKSIEEFNSRGFSWTDITEVNDIEFRSYRETTTGIVVASLTPIPSPSSSLSPSPSATVSPLAPVKINDMLPAPDYIRADWLISHGTSNYGRIGQKIIFKYSDKTKDKIQNFRLYEKKPGAGYFSRIAEFEEILSTGCEDIDIDRNWMITEAGQCGYWAVQKIVPPGGRDATAYLSAGNYSEGEYVYYVVGVDQDGVETAQSAETKLVFLATVAIFSPADNQQAAGINPIFKWNVAGGWPSRAVVDYFVMISDDINAQSSNWTKQLKIETEGKSDYSLVYDGLGLDSTKKYRVNIYGHYRRSESEPDYISIPANISQFWVKSTSSYRPVSLFGRILDALIKLLDF